MAKRQPFTIDKALYQTRSFEPIIEARRGQGEGPVETKDMPPTGCVCVKFTAPLAGKTVSVKGGILPNEKYNETTSHGARTIVSISETQADFSKNASYGLEANVTASSGAERRGYAGPLVPGREYYANVAFYDPSGPQPDLRVQLTIQN